VTLTTDSGRDTDPRVRRTRALLHDAVRGLAEEHPLDEISVAAISDRATVSRATFYLHYADRDALLTDVIDTIVTTEVAAVESVGVVPEVISEATPPPAYLIGFMTDIERHASLFRQLLGPEGSARAIAHLGAQLRRALTGFIGSATSRHPAIVDDDVHAAWLSGALLGIVTHWLDSEPRRSAADVATDIWRLAIQPAVRR